MIPRDSRSVPLTYPAGRSAAPPLTELHALASAVADGDRGPTVAVGADEPLDVSPDDRLCDELHAAATTRKTTHAIRFITLRRCVGPPSSARAQIARSGALLR
jgi:hypothetical protein